MILRNWLLLTLTLFFLSSCGGWFSSDGDNDNVVVSYKETKLTEAQLAHFIPPYNSPEDSARYASFYINQWVKEQAIADEALKKIKGLSESIEFKVQDYKQKLVVHEYTSYLIETHLDTNIAESTIREYYTKESDKLRTKENLYSFFYVVSDVENSPGIRDQLNSNEPAVIRELAGRASMSFIRFELDSTYHSDAEIAQIMKGSPYNLRSTNPGSVVRWSGAIKGEQRRYFFKNVNFIAKGDVLPLLIARDKIKRIILNKRKIKLIEDHEEKIIREAKVHNFIQQNY